MANYRTLRDLKPYKGADITRVHSNGKFTYYGFMPNGIIIPAMPSLKSLRKEINKCLREEN